MNNLNKNFRLLYHGNNSCSLISNIWGKCDRNYPSRRSFTALLLCTVVSKHSLIKLVIITRKMLLIILYYIATIHLIYLTKLPIN